jgi:sarcosine oxidase subunit beta
MKKYDVIVVGGGLAGAAMLYNLSCAGLHTVLLERYNLASGATGRNGGQVIQLDGRDRDAMAIMNRLQYSRNTVALLEEYRTLLKTEFEFRQVGSLDIAATEEECEELKALCDMQIRAGDDEVEYLDRQNLHEIAPCLGDFLMGARYRWSDGNLYPFNLAFGFIERAVEAGAGVHTWCNVKRIVIESGKVCGVETGDGPLVADRVVLATSAWTKELFPELKVIPLRSHAALTEEIPHIGGSAFEVVVDGEIIYGSTQFQNGHILLGGGPDRPRTEKEQYDYTMSWKDTLKNASLLAQLFPVLEQVNILRCWAGTMGTTPDGLPLVGKSEIAEGMYVIAGFPNGMAFIPYLAKLLSSLLEGKKPEKSLDIFNPDRFARMKIELPETYNYTILADYLGRL